MLSITEIEQINQKLNPELALSLSLDNAKRMESSLLHSGFSPSTDMWKLILFYNGSLEEIKEMISFSFIPLLGNFAILFIKEKDIPSFLTFPQVLYVELSRPIYENALTGIDASCFPDYNIVTGRNVNATTLTGKGTAIAVLDSGVDYRHPDFRTVLPCPYRVYRHPSIRVTLIYYSSRTILKLPITPALSPNSNPKNHNTTHTKNIASSPLHTHPHQPDSKPSTVKSNPKNLGEQKPPPSNPTQTKSSHTNITTSTTPKTYPSP